MNDPVFRSLEGRCRSKQFGQEVQLLSWTQANTLADSMDAGEPINSSISNNYQAARGIAGWATPRFALHLVLIFQIKLHTFNGPFSGTTRVSRYQKGKTNLDFTEARDSEWQWYQLGHMQVCTSL